MPEIPVHYLTDREVYDEIAVHRMARRVLAHLLPRQPVALPRKLTSIPGRAYLARIEAAKGELARRRRIDRGAAASRLDSGPGHLSIRG